MLTELTVENVALVERAQLAFGPGLVLLTGETGAGKSILLDALGMALGARVTSEIVRHGAPKARSEASFRLDAADRRILTAVEELGLETEDGLLILAREVDAGGRSTARVNGRQVTIGTLKRLGDILVDIHGQHEHQSLMDEGRHAALLDAWAGAPVEAARAEVAERWQAFHALRTERTSLQTDARERAREIDLLAFQRDEIDAAQPIAGEEETLAAERLRLGSAERLAAAAESAYASLSGAGIDALSRAVSELERAVRLDPDLEEILASARTALYGAEDAARSCRGYRDRVEFQPERLEEIENRLDLLKTLTRKYGDTLEDVLRYRDEAAARLDRLAGAEDRLAELAVREEEAREALVAACSRLTDARRTAARPLAAAICDELTALAMSGTRFEVAIEPREPGPDGADRIAFLISPNPGEPLKPLARIASGGEISRIMLSLKSVLARVHAVPTLVFDEVDAGIGGRTATVLAEKLHRLSGASQVLCITHLPQIAARGRTHYLIEKRQKSGRTTLSVRRLDDDARVDEIARMLGGTDSGTEQAHARELLQAATA